MTGTVLARVVDRGQRGRQTPHMKTKLTVLVALWIGWWVRLSAGELIDGAHLFGDGEAQVREALANAPVWLETRTDIPVGGMKSYADKRAAEVGDRAYYVVVSTNPREWRISMHPTALASPESVRIAGERMISRFKAGAYIDGAIRVADELRALPPPAPRPGPAAQPVTHVPRAVTFHPTPQARDRFFGGILVFVLFAVGLTFIAIVVSAVRNQRRRRAEHTFHSYTPKERAQLVAKHARPDVVAHDPMLFYAMMMALDSSSRGSDDSFSRQQSTGTDNFSSPSSSSFDSASSSSSPSSSDSSGAGGSW